MRKSFYILLILFLFLTSCRTTYNLQNAKNADDQIMECLHSKKIVFIGENHSTVFPILYMTQNIERFYEAGVRYIFLEEEGDGFLPEGNYDNYHMLIVPPWCTFGGKHEYHLMEIEIARVNQLHPEDPIKVIFPEEGFIWPEDPSIPTDVLNARDLQAQKTIIQIMDNAKPEEKAIIFYGDGHGMKHPLHFYGGENLWYMTGYYLNNYYGEQYASIDIYNVRNDDYTKVNYGDGPHFKILNETNLPKNISKDDLSNYDYICATDQRIYGIVCPYITTDYNLRALYKYVADFDIEKSSSYKPRELAYFILGISYLKYCFDEYFPFSFEEDNLETALKHLNETVFLSGKEPSSFCKNLPDYSLEEWEKYAEYLFSYEWFEDYIYGYLDYKKTQKKACGYIIYNMEHAIQMNPTDPWPQYWLAYFLSEKADYSSKKSDYKKAIEAWENFLNHKAAFACPGLLVAYDRIAICYSKLGDEENEHFYKTKKENLDKVFPWNDIEMYFFGYYN